MEDTYNVIMNLNDSLEKSRLFADALDKISKQYQEARVAAVKFDDELRPMSTTIEGVNKAGQNCRITLEKMNDEWQVGGVTIGKYADALKAADKALEQYYNQTEKVNVSVGTTVRQHERGIRVLNSWLITQKSITDLDTFAAGQERKTTEQRRESALERLRNIQAIEAAERKLAAEQLRAQSQARVGAYNSAEDRLRAALASQGGRWRDPRQAAGGVIPDLSGPPKMQGPAVDWAAKLTLDAKMAKESVDGLHLSWQNFGRYMLSHAAYQGLYTVTNAMQDSVAKAAELSKAIATVRTIGQGSQKDWSDSAIKVSNLFGTDSVDIAKGYYSALSNQIGEGVGEIERYTVATQKFALATNSTAEQANNLFASFINTYKLSASSVDELSGKLFKTIDLGRIVASDMASTIGRVIVPAQQLGVSIDQVLGSLALLTQKGVKPADAMTQLLNLFNKLIKPSEELKKQFQSWGYDSAAAIVQLEGFPKLLQRIDDISKTGGLSAVAKQFNDLRGFRGVITLSKDVDLLNASIKQISQSGPEFNNAVETQLENPARSLERQIMRTKNMFIEFGTALINNLDPALKSMGGLDSIIKAMLPSITALGAALATSGLVFTVTQLVSLFSRMNPLILAASAGIAGLGTVIAANGDEFDKLQQKLSKSNAIGVPDDLNYVKRLEAAQRATDELTRRTSVQYNTAMQGADWYYGKLQELEEKYKDSVRDTTLRMTDAFQERMRNATKAVTAANSELNATVSLMNSLEKAMGKGDIGRLLAGKGGSDQYSILESSAASIVKRLPQADKDEQKVLISQLEDIERRRLELVTKSAESKKTERSTAIAERRETLEAQRNELELKKKQIELDNKTTAEAFSGRKGKKPRKQSTTDIADKILDIDRELADIQVEAAQEAITKQKEKNAAIAEERKIAADVLEKDKQRVDYLQQAYNFLVKQKEEEAAILAIKTKDEERARNQQQAYNIYLKQFNDLLNTVNKGGFYSDKDKAQSASRQAGLLTENILNLANVSGVKLAPSDVAVLNALKQSIDSGIKAQTALDAKAGLESSRVANREELNRLKEAAKAEVDAQRNAAAVARGKLKELGFTNVENVRTTDDVSRLNREVSGRRLSDFGEFLKNVSYGLVNSTGFTAAQEGTMGIVLDQLKAAIEKQTQAQERMLQLESSSSANLAPGITTLSTATQSLAESIYQLSDVLESPTGRAMGGMGSDTVSAMLAPGEFVVNSMAAARWRTTLMNMNNGTHMASGGSVSNVNVGDIHISMTSQGSTQADVMAIGHALRREIRRGTIKL